MTSTSALPAGFTSPLGRARVVVAPFVVESLWPGPRSAHQLPARRVGVFQRVVLAIAVAVEALRIVGALDVVDFVCAFRSQHDSVCSAKVVLFFLFGGRKNVFFHQLFKQNQLLCLFLQRNNQMEL